MTGFVYLLDNELMPGVFKVGMTTKPPAVRARDLSNATGVPLEFNVVCYVEVGDPVRTEREMHRLIECSRVNRNREFFLLPLPVAVGVFYHLPMLKRFVDVSATPDLHYGCFGAVVGTTLPNPWVDRSVVPNFSWAKTPQSGAL